MAQGNSEKDDLLNRLDRVIEKSNAQKKILKKILNQLNKKNTNADSQDKVKDNKKK